MFKNLSESRPQNGEIARVMLPPTFEFLVRRKAEHGGDTVVKCNTLGLGRAGALICYVVSVDIDHTTGESILQQRVAHIFLHYLDVGEVDIPAQPIKH